jgi:hypothetical protein
MCISESSQVDKRVDTKVLVVKNWCLKEPRRLPASTD